MAKLIDLYKEWMEKECITEREKALGSGGLCNCLPKKYLDKLKLFTPEDYIGLYWASQMPKWKPATDEMLYKFNPLRQTIVLLIACMHDEI